MSNTCILFIVISSIVYIFIAFAVIAFFYDDLPPYRRTDEEELHIIVVGIFWLLYLIGLIIKFIAFTLFTIVKDINKMIDDIRHFE